MSARLPAPVVLTGRLVALEPLDLARHMDGLSAVALDPNLWRWTQDRIADRADLERYLTTAAAEAAVGRQLPFVIRWRATDQWIGMSRYLAIEPTHRRLEIGHSWVASAWQRRGANLETKLLLLRHAFDDLGYRRVEFKTHAANIPSRAALEGIGATLEGIFRRHMSMPDGSVRDSAYYSVVDLDWPRVRTHLETKVEAHIRAGEGDPARESVSR
jgi:RimJ/RimL family protein N-acetyltransferase